MRIAVTGGLGFQGKALVNRLRQEKHEVTVFDLPKVDFERGKANFLGFDCLYHLAAKVGGTRDTHGANDSSIMFANMRIDQNVIEAAVEDGVPQMVFASTSSVYPLRQSQSIINVVHETDRLDETDLESGYAVAKLAAEAMLYRLRRSGRIKKLIVLRLFNVYGPGDYSSHVIPDLLNKALLEPEVRLLGSGEETRTFLYIDDAVEAYVRALGRDYQAPINVAGKGAVSIYQLANKLAPAKVITRQAGSGSPVRSCIGDITMAKIILGWEPKVPLDEGLRRFKEWRQLVHPPSV